MSKTVYKEDIEQSKRRVEAWWNHEIVDRVVVQVTAPRESARVGSIPSIAAQERDEEAKQLYQQGLFFMISGRLDEAIDSLRRSLAIQVVPETYLGLGIAYERGEDWNKALESYEALKTLFPESDFTRTATAKIQALKEKIF